MLKYAFNFNSDDINRISIGTITNQSVYHDIDYCWNFFDNDKELITAGNISNTGIYHKIKEVI